MSGKSLVKYNKKIKIFSNIKMFILGLFKRNSVVTQNEDKQEFRTEEKEQDKIFFRKELSEKGKSHEELIKLKKEYDSGLVNELDLDIEKVRGLIELYKEEIYRNKQLKKEIEKQIKDYSYKINLLKENL